MFIFLKINFIDFFPFQLLLYFYSFFFLQKNQNKQTKNYLQCSHFCSFEFCMPLKPMDTSKSLSYVSAASGTVDHSLFETLHLA